MFDVCCLDPHGLDVNSRRAQILNLALEQGDFDFEISSKNLIFANLR